MQDKITLLEGKIQTIEGILKSQSNINESIQSIFYHQLSINGAIIFILLMIIFKKEIIILIEKVTDKISALKNLGENWKIGIFTVIFAPIWVAVFNKISKFLINLF